MPRRLPVAWAECTKSSFPLNPVLESLKRDFFILKRIVEKHFIIDIKLIYLYSFHYLKWIFLFNTMNTIIKFLNWFYSIIFRYKCKFYFFNKHFCIFFVGFYVFFIYKRYPDKSRINIFDTEI